SVFCDAEQRIWIGHRSGGISMIADDAVLVFTEADGLINNEVHDIFQTADGRIWIATFGGVSIYDEENWASITTEEGLVSNNIQSISQDDEGNIWLGTYGSGINVLKEREAKQIHQGSGLINNYITDLVLDDGKMLISTLGGLSIWKDGLLENSSAADGLINNQVNETSINDNGDIWLATFNGADRVRDGKRLSLTEENGLPNNEILSVFHDSEGNTWLGTKKGLVRVRNLAFAHYPSSEDLDLEPSFLFKDSKGRLWAGNEAGGALRFDGFMFQRAFEDPDINDHQISSIGEDGDGNIWFGTMDFGGLFQWDGNKLYIYSDEFGLADNNINCLLKDVDGSLLIGTPNGLSRFDGEDFRVVYLSDDFSSNHITALELGADSTVLAGAADGSIFVLKNGEVTSKIKIDASSPVTDISNSKLGLAFATQADGLFIFKDEQTLHVNEASTAQLSSIRSLAQLGNSLYLGTANGMLQIQLDGDSLTVTEFNKDDGFLNSACKRGAMLSDGSNLWVGTTNGITRFTAAEKKWNIIPPTVFLTELQLSYKQVDWYELGFGIDEIGLPQDLSLPYDQNDLRFH
ncbi:MAG: two-component regulator propeller domain-containing protein, partial [Flavobacteriales bacterium]|nr:two-component regulator propeller domain-containing protein [Flavobacteriales bacterium]